MPRSSTNRNGIYRVDVPHLGHVPASVGRLLYMGHMGAVGRMRGTGMGRFRKGNGGQTKNQNKMSDAPQKLSVHRKLSSRNHGI
jgi:hypothetical protein